MQVHSPTLESVQMVEKAARQHTGSFGKYQLWKRLPRKMMYQTYQVIIEYLLESGKIILDKDEKIIWIHDPQGVQKLLQSGVHLR